MNNNNQKYNNRNYNNNQSYNNKNYNNNIVNEKEKFFCDFQNYSNYETKELYPVKSMEEKTISKNNNLNNNQSYNNVVNEDKELCPVKLSENKTVPKKNNLKFIVSITSIVVITWLIVLLLHLGIFDGIFKSDKIPENAYVYNNHYYYVYDQSLSWEEAEKYCNELGGHLASVNSSEEQEFLESLIISKKANYWLGGYLDSDEWKWTDESEFTYSNWDSWSNGETEFYQPDNYTGTECYIRMLSRTFYYDDWIGHQGKWNDTDNNADGKAGDASIDKFGFICEWS